MFNRRWSRRNFLKLGGVAGAALVVPDAWLRPAFAAEPLSGAAYLDLNGFTQPLPRPRRIDATRGGMLRGDVVQFEQQVLSGYPKTTLWGYRFGRAPSWPGATIVAKKDKRIHVKWRNHLPRGRGSLVEAHLLPVDETVHTVDLDEQSPQGSLPVVTHLHGGHVESGSDGLPEAWFTQNQAQKGPDWQAIFKYDNDQEAGTLWYHDHVLGITRLNVYAGLVGLYLLRDDHELGLIDDGVLPGGPYEIELVVQDRWFWDDGQLRLETGDNPDPGSILPSIFPDVMCVNGAPWPYLEVEPRKYRFRLLNASDARFLILGFDRGPPLLRIGTELGLSPEAIEVDRLLVGPAERYDLVVDFSYYGGQSLVLRNTGLDAPLRGFRNAAGDVTNNPLDAPFTFDPQVTEPSFETSQVMEFRVTQPLSDVPEATIRAGDTLRPPLPKLEPESTYTRKVVLLSGSDEFGRGMGMQGTLEEGTFAFYEPVTENPELGAVEIWEIYNFTVPQVASPPGVEPLSPPGLAHPMHIHLVHFQVINRQKFTVPGQGDPQQGFGVVPKPIPVPGGGAMVEGATGAALLDPAGVQLLGAPRGPEPHEQGWKDTVNAYGGEVTRVVARFDRPGKYVWHCHILHHEDHAMMRPYFVGPLPHYEARDGDKHHVAG